MKFLLRSAVTAGLAVAVAVPIAGAEARGGLSEGSELSVEGSAQIVSGSIAGVAGTVDFVIESVVWLAEGVRCTLRASAEVARIVLLLPIKTVGAVSLAAGETIQVVTEGSGWLIIKAGQTLAYIPKETGRALLFSEPVRRR